MAEKKPGKVTTERAAQALAKRVEPEVMALAQRGGPEGVQAAPFDGTFAKKLKKALPRIIAAAIEVGAIAADGQVSADEVKQIAGKVFEFFTGLRQTPRISDPDPAPRAA